MKAGVLNPKVVSRVSDVYDGVVANDDHVGVFSPLKIPDLSYLGDEGRMEDVNDSNNEDAHHYSMSKTEYARCFDWE